MFKQAKGFITGFISCAILVTALSTVFATEVSKTLTAVYDNIKIYVDGTLIQPKDANGNAVEPFVVDGTTYLPVRAVASAFGKEVDWDGNTQSVYLGAKPGAKKYLGFDLKSYQETGEKPTGSIKVGGKTFGNAIVFNPNSSSATRAEAYYNLNGEYTSILGKVGYVDGGNAGDAVFEFYGDEKLIKSVPLKANMFGEDISINVTGVKQLKIFYDADDYSIEYALIEMELIK